MTARKGASVEVAIAIRCLGTLSTLVRYLKVLVGGDRNWLAQYSIKCEMDPGNPHSGASRYMDVQNFFPCICAAQLLFLALSLAVDISRS